MSTETASAGLRFGYARVSTIEQNEDLQQDALQAAGCERVFVDKASGKLEHRPGLDQLLGQLRAGDTVVVWRLDRLGRSLRNLIEIVRELEHRKVALLSLTESIDTTTPGGKLVFHVFGALAEFERDLIRERTAAGLAAARARGRHRWPPDGVDAGEAGHGPLDVRQRPARRSQHRPRPGRQQGLGLSGPEPATPHHHVEPPHRPRARTAAAVPGFVMSREGTAMSKETLHRPEHQHADRQHRRPRARLALPGRGAGRASPTTTPGPSRSRTCGAGCSTGTPSPGRSRSRSPPTLDTMTHLDADGHPMRWAVGPGPAGDLPLRHRRRDGDLRPRLRPCTSTTSGC